MEKELKLGWVVHEVIGQAIVNPRATMKALPRITLTHKDTTIVIRNDSITIDGVVEEAAVALADYILTDWKRDPKIQFRTYRAIEVYEIEGKILVNPRVQNIMDADRWALLKRATEKICNSLRVFM